MPANKNKADDIDALCSHAEIDRARYRVFTPGLEQQASSVSCHALHNQEHLLTPAAPRQLDAIAPDVTPATPSPRRHGLRAAFDQALAGTGPAARALDTPRLLVALRSLPGGCGTTTIQATIARAFSMKGESVVMLDGASQSLLPFYFGSQRFRSGACTFFPGEFRKQAAVHLVLPTIDLAGERQHEDYRVFSEQWCSEGLAQFADEQQIVLVDMQSNLPASWRKRLFGPCLSLTIIGLDLRSTLGLRSMQEWFTRQEQHLGSQESHYFVLNQFEPDLALHQDIYARLQRQLDGRLAPVVIRRSPEIGEALAEGQTVLDYAPGSAGASDIRALADWVATTADSLKWPLQQEAGRA